MSIINELNLRNQKKPSMKKTPFLVCIITIMIFSGCSAPKKESAEEQKHEMSSEEDILAEPTAPQFQTTVPFRIQLNELFSSYVEMNQALVKSDLKGAQVAGSKILNGLNSIDESQISGAALMDWSNYSETMANELLKLSGVSDLAAARSLLPALTETMYKIIKAYGLNGVTAYYAYCPMAFNNKGGYWLSDEKKIQNPYFGDAMLECGRLSEQLK